MNARNEAGMSRLRVAAVQMKFAPTIRENLERIERAVRQAARRRVDAILFPECATTGYAYDYSSLQPQDIATALQAVSSLASQHRLNLLIGSPAFRGGKLQNCLVVFDRTGRPVHCYAKCQLVDSERRVFVPGDAVALFEIDGVCATAVICHERRYPELVRLAVMAGAQILFHPNAGMDALAVSRRKRGGRDGIPVRAFENAIYYIFANSVGPQGDGKWSAGDSKIVAPDGHTLRLADNEKETLVVADIDLALANRKYALDSLEHPRFFASHWRRLVREVRRQAKGEGQLEMPQGATRRILEAKQKSTQKATL